MSEGKRLRDASTPSAIESPASEQPAFLPRGDVRDRGAPLTDPLRFVRRERADASARIGRSLKAWRTAAPGSTESGATEVSQPGEPAEKEADAVADHVADELHGGGKKEADAVGGEKAPKIGAKLEGVGRKIFLRRPDRDPATPRQDVRQVPGSVSTQQGVEILVTGNALQHVLGGHTVENFDPVRRLGELPPGQMTTLFPPGFATNAQEIVTVVKQALGNKGARKFDPGAAGNAGRRIEVTLRKVTLQVWVGGVAGQPGVYQLNSCYPTGGVSLTYADVQRYANEVNNRTRTLQQIRTELVGRFQR